MSRTTSRARRYALTALAAGSIVAGPAVVRATAEQAGQPVPAASPARPTSVLFIPARSAALTATVTVERTT